MNIKDILRQRGYDVMEEHIEKVENNDIWLPYFDIRLNVETRKKLKDDEDCEIDVDKIYSVYIDEIGFNGLGNLYIVLNYDEEEEEKGGEFDLIEFENSKITSTFSFLK